MDNRKDFKEYTSHNEPEKTHFKEVDVKEVDVDDAYYDKWHRYTAVLLLVCIVILTINHFYPVADIISLIKNFVKGFERIY